MSEYLLDTNHAGALCRKLPKPEDKMRTAAGDQFFLCRPSIAELWYMVFNSVRVADNERDLHRFLSNFQVIELDSNAAMEFGRIKAELRRSGRMIPAVDIQIAAISRARNLTLLTADGHFASVPRLLIENWLI